MSIRAACLGALLAAIVPGAAPAAAQVTVGTPTLVPGSYLPFGGYIPLTRYQQVYAASAFPGPLTIGSLTFYRADTPLGGRDFVPGTFALGLSITSRPANALLPALDANVTGAVRAFATVTLGGPVPPAFTIAGTPFVYDPSAGNLLLDVVIALAGPTGTPETYFQADADSELTTSAYTFAFPGAPPVAVVPNPGLVTTFGPAPITTPEPSTAALTAGALLGCAGVARRRADVRRARGGCGAPPGRSASASTRRRTRGRTPPSTPTPGTGSAPRPG